jgi:hypothetical protein
MYEIPPYQRRQQATERLYDNMVSALVGAGPTSLLQQLIEAALSPSDMLQLYYTLQEIEQAAPDGVQAGERMRAIMAQHLARHVRLLLNEDAPHHG